MKQKNSALQCMRSNCYEIGSPSVYGGVIMLMNSKSQFVYSAVYLADDLVFAKYGNNHLQPWLLTHLQDRLQEYPGVKPVDFRNQTE